MDPEIIKELKRRDNAFKTQKFKNKIYDIRDHLQGITKNDPMSPYVPPGSISSFSNISEVVNKKAFKGSYPQSYAPVSDYFRKTGISPYYEPEDFNDYAHGVLTIATMIDLTAHGKPWKLDRDQDLYMVETIIREYYEQLKSDIHKNNKSIQAYRVKVEAFIKALDKSIGRMEKRIGRMDRDNKFMNMLKAMLGGR